MLQMNTNMLFVVHYYHRVGSKKISMKPSPECINEKKEKFVVIREEVDVCCFRVSFVGINWSVRNTTGFLGLLRVTLHGQFVHRCIHSRHI